MTIFRQLRYILLLEMLHHKAKCYIWRKEEERGETRLFSRHSLYSMERTGAVLGIAISRKLYFIVFHHARPYHKLDRFVFVDRLIPSFVCSMYEGNLAATPI